MMLRRMRESFGIDLYEHLSILVNFVPKSDDEEAAVEALGMLGGAQMEYLSDLSGDESAD